MTNPVLLRLTPTTVKVYLACCYLRNKFGAGETFAATSTALQELTGLSQPTVVQARHELIHVKLLREAHPSGHYEVDLRPAQLFCGHLILGEESKGSDLKPQLPHTATSKLAPLGITSPKRFKHRTAVVKGGKVFGGLTIEDRRELVSKACVILGSPRTGRYVQMAMKKLSGLLRDGFTADDAIEVARYARARYDGGDRFMPNLNLLYVWSAGHFTPLLTAARTTPFHEKQFSVLDPEAAQRFEQDYQRRVRERSQ